MAKTQQRETRDEISHQHSAQCTLHLRTSGARHIRHLIIRFNSNKSIKDPVLLLLVFVNQRVPAKLPLLDFVI